MPVKKILTVLIAAATLSSTAVVVAGGASASPSIAGTYNALNPTRILDTRAGNGAPTAVVGPGKTLTFDADRTLGGASVSAVALTITAVTPTRTGYLTAYPAGTARPPTSTLYHAAGRTTPNGAVVKVGTGGKISIYNGSSGSVNLLADLFGYWTGGTVSPDTAGAFRPVTSGRVVDTRTTGGPLASDKTRKIPVLGHGGVPASGVDSVAVNLTVAATAGSGYLTVAQGQQQFDKRTSTINFRPGDTRANLTFVPVAPDGTISVTSGSAKPVNFILDVAGYFSTGTPFEDGAFVSSDPFRQLDTRVGSTPIPPLTTRKVAIITNGTPPSIFKAVAVTVTVVKAEASGYYTTWNGVGPPPATSNVNFIPGETQAGTVIVPVNSDGTISVYNASYGSDDLVVDVHGFFLNDLSGMTQSQARQRVAAGIQNAHRTAAKQLQTR